jgi:hypothetical protein
MLPLSGTVMATGNYPLNSKRKEENFELYAM